MHALVTQESARAACVRLLTHIRAQGARTPLARAAAARYILDSARGGEWEERERERQRAHVRYIAGAERHLTASGYSLSSGIEEEVEEILT